MQVHGYSTQKKSYQGSLRFFEVRDWGWTIVVGRPSKQFRRGWFVRATVVLIENATKKMEKKSTSKQGIESRRDSYLSSGTDFLASLAASRTSANARTKKKPEKDSKHTQNQQKNKIPPIFPEEKCKKYVDEKNFSFSYRFSCLSALSWTPSVPVSYGTKSALVFPAQCHGRRFAVDSATKNLFREKKLGIKVSSDPKITGEEWSRGRKITGEEWSRGRKMMTKVHNQSINQSIDVHHPNEVPLCFWWESSESPSCPTRRPDPTGTPYGPDGTADSSGAVPGWREDCRRSSPCASWTPSRPSPVQRAVLVRTSYREKWPSLPAFQSFMNKKNFEPWHSKSDRFKRQKKVPCVGPYLAKRSFPVLSFFFVLLSSSWTCSSPSSFVESSVRT